MNNLTELIQSHALELSCYFEQSEMIALLAIDENMMISACNNYFKNLVAAENDITGEPIENFLDPESYKVLHDYDQKSADPAILNFIFKNSFPTPLLCMIFITENGSTLIIGKQNMHANDHIVKQMSSMVNEMANMARELHRKNSELNDAHDKIKILSGIVPICMHCKGIRDDEGYWNKLESYISEHSDIQFSHGICDDCYKKYYPEEAEDDS